MKTKKVVRTIGEIAFGIIVVLLLGAGTAVAATYFDYTVPADPMPADFQTLISFTTPTGTGANRKTIARIVTPTPTTGITFQITPPAGKKTAQIVVDGGTDYVDVSGVGTQVATLVRAEVISDVPDNAPVAAGFAMIRVTIEYDAAFDFGVAGETWNLKALEQTGNRRYMGFIATDIDNPATAGTNEVDVLVTKPKISIVETELNFADVQQGISTSVAPVLPVTVRNVGTAPLSISGAPISGDMVPNTFEVSVFITPAINPGGQIDNVFDEDAGDGVTEKKGLWIMAHPGSLGDKTATVTVQSPDGNVAVPLRVKGVTLFAEMVVDTSTSMGAYPNGDYPAPESGSRLTQAKEAGKEINNWIQAFSDGKSYLGLSVFPEYRNAAMSGVVVPIDQSINSHPNIQIAFGPEGVSGLRAVQPTTPLESGIVTAVADLDTRINGPLPPNPADRPNLRQALLIMSDGNQNTTSNAAAQIGPMNTKGIRAYTIGYGVPGGAYVDHSTLQGLATGTSGQFFDANSLDPFALKDAFKGAVTPWLGLRTVADPKGTIRQGQTKTHTVCLDKTVYGVTFSVDWNRHVQGGVSLTLVSPNGETITPASPDVAYYKSNTFAMYVLRGKRLRGGQGAGQWTLRLTGGPGIPSAEDTEYSYNVLAQSPVGLDTRPPAIKLATGSEYLLEVAWAQVYSKATNTRQLSMTAHYNYPAESFGTWLARGTVEPAWIIGEQPQTMATAVTTHEPGTALQQGTIMGEYATLTQRKAYALAKLAKNPFENKRGEGTVQLYDDGTHGDKIAGDGVYSALAPQLRYDGVHKLTIRAEALGTSKNCIQREASVLQYIGIALNRDLLGKHLAWRGVFVSPYFNAEVKKILSAQPPAGYERKSAVFTPQDSFGNYWGPGHASEIQFAVKNGKPIGAAIDNLDGSYIQVVEYKKGDNASVSVTTQGVTSPEVPVCKKSCLSIFSTCK